MTIKIIGALLLIGFFYILSKAGANMIGKDNPLSKIFPIGSSILVVFFLSLMFVGQS